MSDLKHITYRRVKDPESLNQMVNLQRLIWGDNPNAYVPLHMLNSLAHSGAPLIGAFDGNLLVGFSIAFLGLHELESNRPAMANLKLASKRLAVHPDYRDSGIGLGLKLEQKKFANEQGISLITWTFDPLISRNAYLYIRRLGGMVRSFVIDFFGDATGQTGAIVGSDRFLIEWWVTSRRVEERLHGSRKALTLENYLSGNTPIINPATHQADGVVMPYTGALRVGGHSFMLIEIPADNRPLAQDPALGQAWRDHTRQAFGLAFESGYIVTDFVHQQYEGYLRSFYLMGFDGV